MVSWIVSLPRMSRTPMRSSSLSWKLCRIGSGSSALRHRSASSCAQLVGGARLVQHQAVEQLVDHAGVVDEDFREELAPGAQIDVELQARRVEAEQLPQHRLAAERGRHLFEVDQGHVGVGRLGDGAEQLRGDAGEEVPAAARRQERHRLVRELRQVLVRPCTSWKG